MVGAKAAYKSPADGLQQAKDYAEVLGLKFAYSTNGHGIVEFDFLSGRERNLEIFPTPKELWNRLRAGENLKDDRPAEQLLTPYNHLSGKSPCYYQEIGINRTVQSIDAPYRWAWPKIRKTVGVPESSVCSHPAIMPDFQTPSHTECTRLSSRNAVSRASLPPPHQGEGSEKKDFFDQYGTQTKGILTELLASGYGTSRLRKNAS